MQDQVQQEERTRDRKFRPETSPPRERLSAEIGISFRKMVDPSGRFGEFRGKLRSGQSPLAKTVTLCWGVGSTGSFKYIAPLNSTSGKSTEGLWLIGS